MFHGIQHTDPFSFDVVEKLVTFYFHNLGSKWHFGDLQKMGGGWGIVANFFVTSPWVNEKNIWTSKLIQCAFKRIPIKK
jgi:hypothetical protein